MDTGIRLNIRQVGETMWIIVHDPENGEWQVSDGDVGERSTSYDFKTKEEAEKWLDDNA